MIHEPSGQPIRYVKGIPTERGFEEVPEDEIVKGYKHAKGQHVLIRPEELDELKLEAKHTIDMVRFVDEAEIDSRYLGEALLPNAGWRRSRRGLCRDQGGSEADAQGCHRTIDHGWTRPLSWHQGA
jgi:hypothetical protein